MLAVDGSDISAVNDGHAGRPRTPAGRWPAPCEAQQTGLRHGPAGQIAQIRSEPSGQRRAHFSKHVCGGCPLRERCTSKRGRAIQIMPDEELLIAARRGPKDLDTDQHLRRTRHGSSGCSACSPTAAALARAATSAVRKPGYKPHGRRSGQPQPDRRHISTQTT